jgi:hypothetical protein
MPGFRHSPLDDISRIRQDLRDRYQDGFPILKELLQNTDDAGASEPNGAATQLVLVLVKNGFARAGHPLLKTPGLAVLNDGAFTASDAISITSLGMSNKAGQMGAAGKFGLGLKSVFHWAEAFFYFSPHTFTEAGQNQAAPCDLLNPWWSREACDGRHRGWEDAWSNSRSADLAAVEQLARQALNGDRWFGLWIPLRRRVHLRDGEQEVKPIEQRFPSADLDEILGKDWKRRLIETLPLLRRLRTVQVRELDGAVFSEQAKFCVGAGAQSMRFGLDGVPNHAPFRQLLSGTVRGETTPESACVFAGIEQVNGLPLLQEIKLLAFWPSQTAIDGYEQVPEKAEPQGAVVFTRQPANGQGSLRVQHAVFLPLGDPEEITCRGDWRYSVTLHGFFFVDSGRRHIQAFDELPDGLLPQAAQTEMQVIQLWNRTLMHEVVAPLVLPSLDAFVKREQMPVEEVESLVGALNKADTLKPLLPCMCRGQRFVYRLQPGGGTWVLDTEKTANGQPLPWIVLPKPELTEAELVELLPALKILCGQAVVSIDRKPYLAGNDPATLGDEELVQLLGGVLKSAFHNPQQLAYLLKLIPRNANEREADSPLATALACLANALVGERLPAHGELATLWKEFFKRLPTTVIVSLPVESAGASSAIARILAESKLPAALLWQDFREAEGTGSIPWPATLPLLQALGALALNTEGPISQRSAIAVRLLQAAVEKPADWTGQIGLLPLFVAREPGRPPQAVSFTQLQAASRSGHLFKDGEMSAKCAKALAKAAPSLKPLLVQLGTAELLNLHAPECNAAACVTLLREADGLATDFAGRKPLFELLLSAARPNDGDSWSALRCLLHGQLAEWDTHATLFSDPLQADAFVKLAYLALAAVGQSWRLIPHHISSQLRMDDAQKLRLNLLDLFAVSVEALVSEIGPEKADCASLTTTECDTILLQFNDVDVLRCLNLHETLDGRRVRIEGHTYVDDGTFNELPQAFNQLVTRIRSRTGYGRFTNGDCSNQLVNKLSWEAVIEIAIGQPAPAYWWETILTAIGNLGTLRTELRDRVRDVAWLPLAAGGAVKPADLLHLAGLEPELERLPPEVLNGKSPVLRLRESVREHERFNTFTRAVLPSANEASDTLANLLIPHPPWSTGLTGDWSADQVAEWVAALGDAPEQALPVASLVKAFHGQVALRELLRSFLISIGGQLGDEAYAAILKRLASRHGDAAMENRVPIERVFTRYLAAIASQGREVLRACLKRDGVRLLSRAGIWKSANQLAFPCDDLRDEDIVSDTLTGVLASLRPDRRMLVIQPAGHQQLDDEAFNHLANQTRDTLRRYFAPWVEFLPQEIIGAFIATLGNSPAIVATANHFLGPRTIEAIRAELDDCGVAGEEGSFLNQVTHFTIACAEHDSLQANVLSILGHRFPAELRGSSATILLGDGVEIQPIQMGQYYRHVLHLRRLNLNDFSPEQLFDLLRETTGVVLNKVYGLREIVLRPLWSRLGQVAQLHIRIAQNRVVDAAQAFLRQVGAHHVTEVQAVLTEWNEADRRRAEAEEAGRQVSQAVQQRLAEAKRRLRDLLATNPNTQHAILATVKQKINRDYGYLPISVPFEIWQNADDAVVELAVLGRDQTSAERLGFVLNADATRITFVHWGRLVNEFRGADGGNSPDRHFDEDLEKMVVQAISDKRAGEQPSAAVTGKFGLGFKSVFLVSDAPEVVSGSVDFAICGGIYPVRLDPNQRDALVEELKRLAPDHWRRGTIIRLSMRAADGVTASEVLALFQRLASLLVVFSRSLKRLRFRREGTADLEFRWQPEPVCEGVGVGALGGLDPQVSHTLVFSAATANDRLQFLLGLGPDGFTPLPKDVPAFWVTAPTRATPDYGFAVNGPFEPDVGRVRLAPNSKRHEELADELARMLAERLQALWDLAQQDWDALRNKLRLASASTALGFWESLWEVLGRRFAGNCPKSDTSPVAALARRILWQSEHTGLRQFYSACVALPTGLWGEHQSLARLPDLRFEAAGALDREEVFLAASQWPAFLERVHPAQIISARRVASVLRRLGSLASQPEALHLATVIEWELIQGEDLRADPECAARLGQLVTPKFLKALNDGETNEHEDQEHKALDELLPKVLLQAADGSWHKPTGMVVSEGEGVDKDEQMRAAFAPPEARLNPAYTGPALEFFLACRPRLEANVDTMFTWIQKAKSDEARAAAMEYLLHGDEGLRHRLATKARDAIQAGNGGWLETVEEQPWFQEACGEDERAELAVHMLRTRKPGEAPLEPPPPLREEWSAEDLLAWWRGEQQHRKEYTLEGDNWTLLSPDLREIEQLGRIEILRRRLSTPDSDEGRRIWYRLFGLACLMSEVRRTTELRDFWTRELEGEGRFWSATSQPLFREGADKVFDRLCDRRFAHVLASYERAYYWRRLFYDVRKMHRLVWESGFPAVILERARTVQTGRELIEFIRSGHLPGQAPWVGVVGQSIGSPLFFIIRELRRLGVIQNPAVDSAAFFPCRPVRRAAASIGWLEDRDIDVWEMEDLLRVSEALHEKVRPVPELCRDYDIPLLHMGVTCQPLPPPKPRWQP